MAAQYEVPFVLVMLNNANLGLIRQAEIGYDMRFGVDLAYTGGTEDEAGIDHVRLMEAMGCLGRRVDRPEGIRPALAWARERSAATRRPVLVEVMIEREANAAMGLSLDVIKEFEPVPDAVPV